MKKTLVILSAMLTLLSCAKITEKEIEKDPQEDETIVSNPVTFNITVADMETKAASKTAWTDGDKIYVVFKGLETKYLLLTYNSGTWGETPSSAFDESDFTGLAEKKITSVFFPVDVTPALSAGVLSFTDGSSNPVYTYYLKEEDKAYTVDGATANLNISLAIAGDYAQFHIPGIQANVRDYTLKANLVKPVACSSITASSGAITENEASNGAPFKGFADADGGVFSARIVDPDINHDYTFTLISTNNVYTFEKNRSLAGGKFYKFKELSDVSWQKSFGQFTINASGDKVTFSPGNLQYKESAWSFHTNQWDVLPTWSSTSCDLFYWEEYGNYGCEENYTGDSSSTVDWGDNLSGGWRTLSRDEWAYLFAFFGRPDAVKKNGNGRVNGVNGMILLPDNWTLPDGLSFTPGDRSWFNNSYDAGEWSQMESAGAVFLPAAGARQDFGSGVEIFDNGSAGLYWSSTKDNDAAAYNVYFHENNIYANNQTTNRLTANSVRLVKSVSSSTPAHNVVNLGSLSGNYVAFDGDVLTGTLNGNYQISIADGATVTLNDATITCLSTGAKCAGITCIGDATILLSGTNSVKGGMEEIGIGCWPGIFVPAGKTLIIDGSGSLTASSGGDAFNKFAPGIGGISTYDINVGAACGNIEIRGGSITASGGWGSAAIGGSQFFDCGTITITGTANVIATGEENGPGIGSGWNATCKDITISSNGTVTATGGYGSAGIGSGYNGTCNNITISSNGTVTAMGGDDAAGIGTGLAKDNPNQCRNIIIEKGTVIAMGGSNGAGIGTGAADGKTNQCGDILISGGSITATGDNYATAIGTAFQKRQGNSTCGTITIENTVTKITATWGGADALNYIGRYRNYGTCGTVTIDGVPNATSASTFPHFNSTVSNNTWTLTRTVPAI